MRKIVSTPRDHRREKVRDGLKGEERDAEGEREREREEEAEAEKDRVLVASKTTLRMQI